ncbi:hypothetical protein [Runella limosa]|uniref:hypothetical protein n=1 Tax=Runella limosa TaxID=370978 RepID=UPI00048E274A|nr:hypothetical protein [Runella limosa]
MKKTATSLSILILSAFTVLGQSVTLTPTTDKQLTLTAAGVTVPNITGQRSNGTSNAPTALPSGAWMMSIYGRGYNGSGYSNNYSAAINFGAAQNFTPTANGSNIQFYTTSLNTLSTLERMRIDHNGNVGIGTTTPETKLQVGDYNTLNNQSITVATAGGNQFVSELKLRHFNQNYGWSIQSDERLVNGGQAALLFRSHFNNADGDIRLAIHQFSGSVGIGTTSFSTGEKFAVRNGTTQFGIFPGYFGNIPDANWTTFNSTGLRISSEISVTGNIATNSAVDVGGFSKLGADAPFIKVKKLTGTTGAAQGEIIPVPHGLTSTKILSITVLVQFELNGQYVPHSYTNTNGYQFDFYSDATNIQIRNHPTNSGQILSKPIKVMITYEQ